MISYRKSSCRQSLSQGSVQVSTLPKIFTNDVDGGAMCHMFADNPKVEGMADKLDSVLLG